ncbi:MAG: methyltransferase domain-containing protein [Candidatus Zipacnadales bacterium]
MDSAIEYHSQKAPEFSWQHSLLAAKQYFASPFAYGRWRLREALSQLIPSSGNGHRLVDVGSGTGEEVALYLAAGYDAIGVEPAPNMRSEALRRHPELADRILEGTGEKLPLASGSVDIVLSIEVLRYIEDPLPFAREVHRVLHPGGAWVFTVTPPTNWAFGAPLNWLRCQGVPLPFLQPVRQYWHTAARLLDLAQASGLRLTQLRAASYMDFVGMVLYNLHSSLGALWGRTWHPVWRWMEQRQLIPWVSGYYVVKMEKHA